MSAWLWKTAVELADAVRTGAVSAMEVTEAHLDRIAAVDGGIGAFLHVARDEAMDQARAVDAAVSRGETAGALLGVPVGLKDVLCTRGMETTAGSRVLEGWKPAYDATAVERLRAAGAVILGKLNLDEFAMGSSTENSAYKPCRNPWDTRYVPGGSSGGSAAAVAAGMCAVAVGTDTGGSIRQPASFCGCVGVRPTYGRVSRRGVVAYASSLDQVGPLARSVEDAALALEVMSGEDPLDDTTAPEPVPRFTEAVRAPVTGMRIGVPEEFFADGLDPRVAGLVRAAIGALGDLGARIVPISLPHTRYSTAAYYVIATAEASSNLARYDGIRFGSPGGDEDLDAMYRSVRTSGFGAEARRRILLGTYVLSAGYYDAYYLHAQKVRALIKRDFDRAFAESDAIATPVSPVPPFRLGEKAADPLAMYLADVYTVSSNLAGLPGLSVPCGFTDDGLPVGLQLLGPAFGEEAILRAASGYQAHTAWHTRRPQVA